MKMDVIHMPMKTVFMSPEEKSLTLPLTYFSLPDDTTIVTPMSPNLIASLLNEFIVAMSSCIKFLNC